jgi:hypothetical protein
MCVTGDLKKCSRDVRRLLYSLQPLHEIEQELEVKNHGKHTKKRGKKNRRSVAGSERVHIRCRSAAQPIVQAGVKATSRSFFLIIWVKSI